MFHKSANHLLRLNKVRPILDKNSTKIKRPTIGDTDQVTMNERTFIWSSVPSWRPLSSSSSNFLETLIDPIFAAKSWPDHNFANSGSCPVEPWAKFRVEKNQIHDFQLPKFRWLVFLGQFLILYSLKIFILSLIGTLALKFDLQALTLSKGQSISKNFQSQPV